MILNLFGGAGGWSTGAAGVVAEPILSLEIDPDAAQTHRQAHGMASIVETDVRYVHAQRMAAGQYVEGLIASPPCQTFSRAGAMSGHKAIKQLRAAVRMLAQGAPMRVAVQSHLLGGEDERTLLILEPMRFIAELEALAPLEWVAMEEVPLAEPVFQAYQDVLREMGFSVWCGPLETEDFGVAQRRQRVVLVASRVAVVGRPHVDTPKRCMDDVLDLGYLSADAVLKPGSWTGTVRGRGLVRRTSPAPTLAFGRDYGGWEWVVPDTSFTSPLTQKEAAALQGFPDIYPWFGRRPSVARQISNAIPPPMAAQILRVATS